ncbi:GNAT family N-acetyltransferase [uncultured Faecalicoccus sp.]|uniref:GNAT family N-acetyltransferase n=1 Tax=uncultured Faecalicoccus sp. TaxID=1971760 RepID=UPI002610589F|nr:GNAT family N-acetyltransferase [uncultured Faecalicoccus sp.]
MILDQSVGRDKEIRRLLSRSMLNMDSITISSWMKYQYDPKSMFCYVEDNKVTSCLQTKERKFTYQGKTCSALVITLACTLPDYRQRNHFSQLLEAAMNYANCNHMLSMAYTNFPKLLEAKSFQAVSKTKYYWLELKDQTFGSEKNVKTYRPDMDLYSLYLDFLNHFDGSILLDKESFINQIHYYLNCNHRIVVMTDDRQALKGFAIYKVNNEHIEIKRMIYLDAAAIKDLLAYLSPRCESASFTLSQAERLEKIFPMEIPRNQGTVLARLNNYKLFSIWSHQNVHHAREAFDLLEKPCWNHFID